MPRKGRTAAEAPIVQDVPAPAAPGPDAPAPAPFPRRTRRKLQSRDRVISAAMDLFVRQGFDQTTVKQIVTAGGISMRTFFRYFQSKMDLAFPRSEEGTLRLQALLETHHDPADPLGGVHDALIEFGRWYTSIREDLLREWKYESHSVALIARAAEIERNNQLLLASELENCGIASARARYLASVIFGGITANLAEWFENECRGDLLETAGDTLVLIRGLDRLFLRRS